MAHKTTLKIFVASSNELKEEREKCIFLFNKIGKLFKHLHLEPVHWEYDIAHSTYPNLKDAQKEINKKLKECQLVIFIFYSRIGKYTLEEFRLANKLKKDSFIFFKTGFSPKTEQIESFRELREFFDGLTGKALPIEFSNNPRFEQRLTDNLNLYLSEKYQSITEETLTALSQTNQVLVTRLGEKDKEIKELKESQNQLPVAVSKKQLQELILERENIKHELLKSEEVKKQLAKDKADLEKQLAPQIAHDALKAMAFKELENGNYAEAENYLMQSAKESVEETASTFFELAKIKKLQLLYSEALHFYELAAKINPDNSQYLNDAGFMADNMGYHNNAIDYFQKALIIDTKIHGDEHHNIAAYYNNLGMAYDKTGKYDQAIECYKMALKIDTKFDGDENLNIATTYNNIGLAYHHKEEYTYAIEYYLKALEIDKKYREESSDSGIYYNNLGLSHHDRDEFDLAIKYYKIALKVGEKFLGKEHPDMSARYNNIGVTYRAKKNYSKAIQYYKMALAIDKKLYGEEHPNIAVEYNNIGMAYNYKGEYDKAIDFCEKALIIFLKFLPEIHPTAQTIKENIEVSKKGWKKKSF